MTTYNGHISWNAWNVSLWINNDESLYRFALSLVKQYGIGMGSVKLAQSLAGEKTPDGARYNLPCIREALRGMEG
jgi:hypothetical protein